MHAFAERVSQASAARKKETEDRGSFGAWKANRHTSAAIASASIQRSRRGKEGGGRQEPFEVEEEQDSNELVRSVSCRCPCAFFVLQAL